MAALPITEQLADRNQQQHLRRQRKLAYFEKSIRKRDYSPGTEDGWFLIRENKNSVRVGKEKNPKEMFEDRIWTLFSDMGFSYLSYARNLAIQFGPTETEVQNFDLLALDNECALVVKFENSNADSSSRAQINNFIDGCSTKKHAIIGRLRDVFKRQKIKICFLFITNTYKISNADRDRMESAGIRHISNVDIEYFRELANHIGEASRFQLHAELFAGQDIPELDNKVPAVEGRMGGHVYYTFSAAPATLLKLGFVLHRTKSVRLTPSYQRLIKKSRLKNIQRFVENGGFFPNSLLVNIETNGKRLTFDPASAKSDNRVTKLGILHLPPRYRSIYIIDGQHRLYAYSGSPYAENNSLPVVAFVNLDRREQLRLFMEINENQKSVNRNLKNTLDADLKWDSANLRDRAEGIKKQIAIDLGDDPRSPLSGRVQVGEDEKTPQRVITLEAILKGINRTQFLGKFNRSSILEHGIFYTGKSEDTLEKIKEFLFESFNYTQNRLNEEWQRSPEDGGLLCINAGITSFIWLLNDIVIHLQKQGSINLLNESASEIVKEMDFYLEGFIECMKSMTLEERLSLRTKYGSGADTRLWRRMQKGIADFRQDFRPDGMLEYWKNQSKQFNMDTFDKIGEIEGFLKEEIRESLEKTFGENWLKKGIPGTLFEKLYADAAKKNREIEETARERHPWDCMYIINYRDVMLYGTNWSNIFHNTFTIPGHERDKKENKTKWLVKLNEIRNQNAHDQSVTESDYRFTLAIHDWLINENPDDIVSIFASKDS